MAALSENVPKKVLHELLVIDAKTRELLCHLETSLLPLEVGNVTALAMSSTTGESEVDPESVEKVCEKVISTLKSIAAGTRKYCDLDHPERRERTTRRSFRQDSGIGSGYFPDDAIDPNTKPTSEDSVLSRPIQESLEPHEEQPVSEASSAVEHTDMSDKETSHL